MMDNDQNQERAGVARSALFAVLDALIGLPVALVALIWACVVFLALLPFCMVAAIHVDAKTIGLWLRDRVKLAREGHISGAIGRDAQERSSNVQAQLRSCQDETSK